MTEQPHQLRHNWMMALVLGWLVLTIGMLALRTQYPSYTESDAGLFFWDNDTVRRLARLEAIDTAADYPVHSVMDGYPTGSTGHWTLPMDWLIRSLDAVLPSLHPRARSHETGAAWAGVVLAGLSGLLFLLLAVRWLGFVPGAISAMLYAVAVPIHVLTQFGNGDHAALHHALLVPALLGWASMVSSNGKRSTRAIAILTGMAFGGAMWVSTETMAVLAAVGIAIAVELTLAVDFAEQRARLLHHLDWLIPSWLTCAVGAWAERSQTGLALEWDRVSAFQLGVIGLLILFVAVAMVCQRRVPFHRALPWIGGVVTGGFALLAYAAIAPLREAMDQQLTNLAAANRWTQTCVREYAPLWIDPATHSLSGAFARAILTFWIYLLPVFAWFFARIQSIPLSGRVATLTLTAIVFALLCLEIKFAHLFTILYLPVLIGGGAEALRSMRVDASRRRLVQAVGATVLLGSFAWPLQSVYVTDNAQRRDMAVRAHMLDALQRLAASPDRPERVGVLAQWGLGAHVMHYGRKPTIASGYHRNLAGIRASFAALTRTDLDEAHRILTERQVGWIVRKADAGFLFEVGQAFPDLGVFGTLRPVTKNGRTGLQATLSPAARDSLWKLLDGEVAETTGFQLVYQSPLTTSVLDGTTAPVFQIYAVLGR